VDYRTIKYIQDEDAPHGGPFRIG